MANSCLICSAQNCATACDNNLWERIAIFYPMMDVSTLTPYFKAKERGRHFLSTSSWGVGAATGA
eukprot:scaffold18936_cov260-Skeletonema_marinoi.AAC.1